MRDQRDTPFFVAPLLLLTFAEGLGAQRECDRPLEGHTSNIGRKPTKSALADSEGIAKRKHVFPSQKTPTLHNRSKSPKIFIWEVGLWKP